MNSKPAVNWGANCHRTWAWFHFHCFSVIKATHCWTEPCNVTAIILVSAAELFHQTWRELHSTCFWVCRSEMLVQISNILKHPLPLSAAKIDQSSGISERGSLSYTLLAWIRDTQTGSVIHIRQAGPKRSEMDILWHHEDFCRFIVHIGTVSDVCVCDLQPCFWPTQWAGIGGIAVHPEIHSSLIFSPNSLHHNVRRVNQSSETEHSSPKEITCHQRWGTCKSPLSSQCSC